MQITFDHTDLANPACRRILAALLDRDEPQQSALDLEINGTVPQRAGRIARQCAEAPQPGRALSDAVTAPALTEPPQATDTPDADLAVSLAQALAGLCNGAPPAPTAPPQPVFDLDADGAVWDTRLHSSSRTKTADGRWKKRRGSADLPPPATAATPAPVPTEQPAPAATSAPAEPVIPWGDAPAAPPAAPVATPAPAPVDASAFPAFMQHVAKLQAAKMLPMVTLLEIIKRHGFATLIELSKQPEAIPAVMTDLPSLPEAQL